MTSTTEAEATAYRIRDALKLRQQGHTYREIARQLNISVSTAHHDITTALADIPASTVNEQRAIEVERLDQLQLAIWQQALDGDLAAIDRIVRIIDRRARLLGLDAPTRLDVGSPDVDLDATVAKLLRVTMNAGQVDD